MARSKFNWKSGKFTKVSKYTYSKSERREMERYSREVNRHNENRALLLGCCFLFAFLSFLTAIGLGLYFVFKA